MAFTQKIKFVPRLIFRSYCTHQDLTLLSQNNGVRRVTLNNLSKRNALSSAMIAKLSKDILQDVDNNVRCIVLQNSGPVFSSGHDLKELSRSEQKVREDIFKQCSDLMVGIRKIPVPVVAVVNGLAAAAGCQLIASCDITIASAKSQFSTPGASVGLFCSTPGVAVSRNIPLKTASYMLLTGNALNANEALQCGLVSKVSEESELEDTVEMVLQSILSKSRAVLALGKKFFYDQINEDIETAYNLGSDTMLKNLAHKDAEEGIKAFFEKRPPHWS